MEPKLMAFAWMGGIGPEILLGIGALVVFGGLALFWPKGKGDPEDAWDESVIGEPPREVHRNSEAPMDALHGPDVPCPTPTDEQLESAKATMRKIASGEMAREMGMVSPELPDTSQFPRVRNKNQTEPDACPRCMPPRRMPLPDRNFVEPILYKRPEAHPLPVDVDRRTWDGEHPSGLPDGIFLALWLRGDGPEIDRTRFSVVRMADTVEDRNWMLEDITAGRRRYAFLYWDPALRRVAEWTPTLHWAATGELPAVPGQQERAK